MGSKMSGENIGKCFLSAPFFAKHSENSAAIVSYLIELKPTICDCRFGKSRIQTMWRFHLFSRRWVHNKGEVKERERIYIKTET